MRYTLSMERRGYSAFPILPPPLPSAVDGPLPREAAPRCAWRSGHTGRAGRATAVPEGPPRPGPRHTEAYGFPGPAHGALRGAGAGCPSGNRSGDPPNGISGPSTSRNSRGRGPGAVTPAPYGTAWGAAVPGRAEAQRQDGGPFDGRTGGPSGKARRTFTGRAGGRFSACWSAPSRSELGRPDPTVPAAAQAATLSSSAKSTLPSFRAAVGDLEARGCSREMDVTAGARGGRQGCSAVIGGLLDPLPYPSAVANRPRHRAGRGWGVTRPEGRFP